MKRVCRIGRLVLYDVIGDESISAGTSNVEKPTSASPFQLFFNTDPYSIFFKFCAEIDININ